MFNKIPLYITSMKEMTSWLIQAPSGGVAPCFDKYALIVFKIFYVAIRIIFRIILGKQKRDRSTFFQKLYVGDSFSISFLLTMYFYKIRRIIGIDTPTVIKIKVPQYNYQAYCSLNKDDFINLTIREQDILDQFNPDTGDTVIDVGAHTGRYTLISSNRVGIGGKVIAIEANPAVFNMLNKNIDLNKLSNVTSLKYAVFSQETQIKLFLPDKKENKSKFKTKIKNNNTSSNSSTTIYNTIMTDRASDSNNFVVVDANTLDNLIQRQGIDEGSINWIKIDVEGAELEVLKGAHNILSKNQRISILIEIHDLGNGKNYYDPIVKLLGSYGFEMKFEKNYDGREKHIIMEKKKNVKIS